MKKQSKNISIQSILDRDYTLFVFDTTYRASKKEKDKWKIFEYIMDELMWLGDDDTIQKIKYRITDGENPKKVFIESLENSVQNSQNLEFFKLELLNL